MPHEVEIAIKLVHACVQDMIQNMFQFLPNGEPLSILETTHVGNTAEPVYDTPVKVPRPIGPADSQPVAAQSVVTAPSKQPRQKPVPVARARSSKVTVCVYIVYIFILTCHNYQLPDVTRTQHN